MGIQSVLKPIAPGSTFSNQLVICRAPNDKKKNDCYSVKCILCGHEKIIRGNDLRRGHSLGCPNCKKVEASIKNLNKQADSSIKKELKDQNQFTKKKTTAFIFYLAEHES